MTSILFLVLFRHNFAMNYVCLYEVNCEDMSDHQSTRHIRSIPVVAAISSSLLWLLVTTKIRLVAAYVHEYGTNIKLASSKGVTAVTTATWIQFTLKRTIYNVWVLGKEVKPLLFKQE